MNYWGKNFANGPTGSVPANDSFDNPANGKDRVVSFTTTA
jgi:hypothetical protein